MALWEKAVTLVSSTAKYTFVATSMARESQKIRAPYVTHFPIQIQLGITGRKKGV